MKLLVQLDTGETVSLNTCHFVRFEACGCPSGVVKAGGTFSPVNTEEDAWTEFYPTRRERDRAKRRGRMVLMTHAQYVADVSPQMTVRCPHGADTVPGQEVLDA
jgi:hypothetical protein